MTCRLWWCSSSGGVVCWPCLFYCYAVLHLLPLPPDTPTVLGIHFKKLFFFCPCNLIVVWFSAFQWWSQTLFHVSALRHWSFLTSGPTSHYHLTTRLFFLQKLKEANLSLFPLPLCHSVMCQLRSRKLQGRDTRGSECTEDCGIKVTGLAGTLGPCLVWT